MTDQIRISDNGELESVPVTWDGEPLYSPTTVQEGLFASEAFKQMPGQTSMETDATLNTQIQDAARLGGSRQVNIRIVDGQVVSA